MFSWLLSAVGLTALKAELTTMARRARQRFILFAVAAILWVVAFGFALAALTVWLAGVFGPMAAYLIIAAAFAVIAVALLLIASAVSRREPQQSVAALLAEVQKAGNANAPTDAGSLAIIALAGYVMGRELFGR
jgi:hypothetical protein